MPVPYSALSQRRPPPGSCRPKGVGLTGFDWLGSCRYDFVISEVVFECVV